MEYPAHLQTMVDVLVEEVDKIHAIDASLGDTRASGRQILNRLMDDNKATVAEARQNLHAWVLDLDPTRQVIFAQVLRTEAYKIALETVNKFIEDNSPPVEEQSLSDEVRAEKFAARSESQKLASQMRKVLEIMLKATPELLAELPEVPAGLKGSFGKRGPVGRKISGTFFYTIDDVEKGNLTTAQAAKIAGCKTSELRVAVTNAYPGDSTPDVFTVEIDGVKIHAVRDTEADDVDDEEDDDPTGEDDDNFE